MKKLVTSFALLASIACMASTASAATNAPMENDARGDVIEGGTGRHVVAPRSDMIRSSQIAVTESKEFTTNLVDNTAWTNQSVAAQRRPYVTYEFWGKNGAYLEVELDPSADGSRVVCTVRKTSNAIASCFGEAQQGLPTLVLGNDLISAMKLTKAQAMSGINEIDNPSMWTIDFGPTLTISK